MTKIDQMKYEGWKNKARIQNPCFSNVNFLVTLVASF